jgi:class 3 adenylate cyclase
MIQATPIVGAVMDIVVWLRSLGLRKYEAAFRENEIDETVLRSLTHETLKELGVTAVGHRLKLLDAIAAMRRQVTVMFSAFVGSTALSARLDAEDFRDVIARTRNLYLRSSSSSEVSSQSTWATAFSRVSAGP